MTNDKGELAASYDRIIRQSAGSIDKATLRIGWYRLLLGDGDVDQ